MTRVENYEFYVPFQVKTPIVNAKTKVLAPGLPGHQAPVKGTAQASEKRKKDTESKEVCRVLLTSSVCLSSLFIVNQWMLIVC